MSSSAYTPALPAELVLLIIEAGASSSKPAAAVLSLVSRAARAAALPHLFRTLILHKRKHAHALVRFLHAHPNIARFVRALWMRESTGADAALLAACPRLDAIAVLPACLAHFCAPSNSNSSSVVLSTPRHLLLPKPSHLVLFPGHCDWLDVDTSLPFAHAYLSNLTHLWLTQPAQLAALLRRRRVLALLAQRLTHLAVPWYGSSSIPSSVFDALPCLEALVVIVLPKPVGLRAERDHDDDGDGGYNAHADDNFITDHASPEPGAIPEPIGFPLDRRVRLYAFLDAAMENSVFPLWKEHCAGGRGIWDLAVRIVRPSSPSVSLSLSSAASLVTSSSGSASTTSVSSSVTSTSRSTSSVTPVPSSVIASATIATPSAPVACA